VYWVPLYDILEERGFEVYLVNARHTKNLPGRKSDVQETTSRTRGGSGDLHSTDAESTDPDEPAIGQRD
jgi:hypothetical protein